MGNDELTPGWSEYRKTVYYDAYDVTPLVRQGQNALGVMLGNGMYRVLHTPERYTKFEGKLRAANMRSATAHRVRGWQL